MDTQRKTRAAQRGSLHAVRGGLTYSAFLKLSHHIGTRDALFWQSGAQECVLVTSEISMLFKGHLNRCPLNSCIRNRLQAACSRMIWRGVAA